MLSLSQSPLFLATIISVNYMPSKPHLHPTPSSRSLDDFGVEYIELTSPAASPESRAHCEAICKLGLKRTKILTHIRCHMDDARIAVETGQSSLR